MHMHSRWIPRPSASSPLNNRAHPMANTNQAPDLESLHHVAEQVRIMNENIAHLIQYLAITNPPPPATEPVPAGRSCRSRRSGDDESQSHQSTGQARNRRRRSPSVRSKRERSPTSLESRSSNRTPKVEGEEIRRHGRSPRLDDQAPKHRGRSTTQKIKDLDARIDAINIGTGALVIVEALIKQIEAPFTEKVMRTKVSSRFKLPTQLGVYKGKTDPMDHLDSYKNLMSLQGYSDEVMCKPFFATLNGSARSWFRKLSSGTIDSFGNLSRLFVANFMSYQVRKKYASYLFTIHQKKSESLKDYIKRFNQAVLEVKDPSDKVVIMAMMEGLRSGTLFDSLSKNVHATLSAL
ncbi:Serine/arginine-rich SC35-like splicing factor [Actinidia chinensis var. chinensis]|uniref:Serine/arginine-rich SC35-like splicing factor n=1 Tax=Actinidia chinensis var. chinensis TaxID=1590841 RepID=A0A2R6R5G5_ACTCC|nr:Serine/arginine-rich SC35-like splicing factor [Actinidia chinensis var. chinensis]